MGTETEMNCNEELAMGIEEDCKLKQFQKNLYYNGKLLTASDFIKESSYVNETRHLINRLVLGSGVVCGQKVVKVEKVSEKCYCGPDGEPRMVADRWRAEITAGVSVDCVGREIVVSKSGKYFISGEILPEKFGSDTPFGVYIRQKITPVHPTPTPSNASCCEEVCCYSHAEEGFELVFDQLPQITKLTFDRTTYAPEDSAFIYLFKPLSEEIEGTKEVKVTNKTTGESTNITLEKLSESSQLGVDVYVNRDPFKIVGSMPPPVDEILFAGLLLSEGDIPLTATASIVKKRYSKKFEKRRIGRDYYEIWLNECSCCEDAGNPKVLLAALAFGEGEEEENKALYVDENRTTWHRNIVYNNRMLYDLISCHLVDLEKTSIQEPSAVRAIERLEVKTEDGGSVTIGNLPAPDTRQVPKILLKAENGIILTPERNTIGGADFDTLTIGMTTGTGMRGYIKHDICEMLERNFEMDVKVMEPGNFVLSLPIDHAAGSPQGKVPGIILGIEYRDRQERSGQLNNMENIILSRQNLRDLHPLNGPAIEFMNDLRESKHKEKLFFKAVNITEKTFQILVMNNSDLTWTANDDIPPWIHWWALYD